MADQFNLFFANIAEKIVEEIHPSNVVLPEDPQNIPVAEILAFHQNHLPPQKSSKQLSNLKIKIRWILMASRQCF